MRRLGERVEGLGRALAQPGRLRRKLSGIRLDEDVMGLAQRPYMRATQVHTVLDVGANEGQFARTALQAFPAATIYCFEPLPSAQAALQALASQHDGRVQVMPFALGETEGDAEMNVTEFSPSSSILPVMDGSPLGINVAHTTRVPVRRLTDWAAGQPLGEDIVLKMDVQGYEAAVLRGGLELLPQVRTVIAETSFVPLYRGQSTLGELCSILEPRGLRYCEAVGRIRDKDSGEPLWQDSVFVR